MDDHQLFRLIALMDSHFAADDQAPADAANWRELKRRIVRMKDGLDMVHNTLRDERERGIPFMPETARKIEGYARFGLREDPPRPSS
jgi:hypothetical protein